MKVNVYIDGFNFYYGAVRRTPHKWLDLRKLMVRSLPEHEIHRIKYFTADVIPRANDPDQPKRQKAYLNALQTLPRFTIKKGLFKSGTRRYPLAPSEKDHPKLVEVMYTEEKGSGVNLATEILLDVFRQDASGVIVVSDDSDLIPPIEAIRRILKAPVSLLNPFPWIDLKTGKKRYRKDLWQSIMTKPAETSLGYKHLDHLLLGECQFPNPVVHPRTGRKYFKPKRWDRA